MIVKLVAYRDEFSEAQDSPMYEVLLNEPTLEEFKDELKDFVEAIEVDLEES